MGLLVTLAMEFGKAFMLGMVVFFLPPVISRALPQEYGDKIVNQYAELTLSLLGKAILLIRSGGGMTLKKATWDADQRNMKIRLGGDWKHFSDPQDFLSRWQGRPFGIAHEDRSTILTPRVMDIGNRVRRIRENGEDQLTDKHGDRYWRAFLRIPKEAALVKPRGALAIVSGNAKPDLPERTQTYVEKGHLNYDSSTVMQAMPWLVALGASFGMMWLASELVARGAAGGGGSVVPIMIGVMP